MSIEDEIVDKVARGMLFPVLPYAAGDTARRALLVGEKLWAALSSPEGDSEWERRIGELQADLEVFVTSPSIDHKYLFLLYPSEDAVWEIRSTRTGPSMRVLGLFAKKDVLIAGDLALREDLGGWQSRAWKSIKRNVRAIWRSLFPPYDPVTTVDVNDVVTGAVSGKYYK